jgi:hypothetical protein
MIIIVLYFVVIFLSIYNNVKKNQICWCTEILNVATLLMEPILDFFFFLKKKKILHSHS